VRTCPDVLLIKICKLVVKMSLTVLGLWSLYQLLRVHHILYMFNDVHCRQSNHTIFSPTKCTILCFRYALFTGMVIILMAIFMTLIAPDHRNHQYATHKDAVRPYPPPLTIVHISVTRSLYTLR
jgi:hypothetical protein